VTTATFSEPGVYVLRMSADDGQSTVSSSLMVEVQAPPPASHLDPVQTRGYRIESPLWDARTKAVVVNWIPHCIDQINRTDLKEGAGGIDNFIEAAKALRGEPHRGHRGYVFSNAWVHQTVEAMSNALMIDPKGDQETMLAHAKMKATLEDWIPKILAAQHPDGYLQTAFTLRDRDRWAEPWSAQGRGNHEGYTAGYFLESAINHYLMTAGKDARLYDAARRLADCWFEKIGPAPKREWFDGHQGIEQALVRFGRLVNETELGSEGRRYLELAKFLLDCRKGGTEYDQSHLPVVQQYEAVGHAVRALYTYSAMADIATYTRDVDYQSAVVSLSDSIVNRKYYVTGGVGSGETSEGFGPDYSLPNDSYCETCSSCGEIFLQWKLNLLYRDAKYADLYEETLYNALLGSLDLDGRAFYYTNPLDASAPRTSWHDCPCCVGNLGRTLLMLPTWMYATSLDGLYINLFIGSTVAVENVAGTIVQVVQATDYPWSGKVSITVNPYIARRFPIRIRVPNRTVSSLYSATPDSNGISSILVNGTAVTPAVDRGYAVIVRQWKAGDRIDLVLPMKVQRVRASERVAATRGRVALRYGPLVYNIESVDQDITKALAPDSALTTQWRGDLLGGVMAIKGTFADGSPLLAIPNFARTNREPAESRPPLRRATSVVWIREA
jgi:hypothetical protein